MFIYFAEPIDFAGPTELDHAERMFRDILVTKLVNLGHTVYRPATAWTSAGGVGHAETIEVVNRAALAEADVLLARLPKGVVSHGVPMEIEFATRQHGIRCVVSGPSGVSLTANHMVNVIDEFDTTKVVEAVHTTPIFGNFKALFHTGTLRPKSYAGDAGIDLTTTVQTTVEPNSWALVPTGNRIEIPHGMLAWVTNRSSTVKNFGLMVFQGIIDEGYTGDYYASVWNLTDKPVVLVPGDRVAQVLFLPNMLKGLTPVEVNEIEERDRGSNGFGSTG